MRFEDAYGVWTEGLLNQEEAAQLPWVKNTLQSRGLVSKTSRKNSVGPPLAICPENNAYAHRFMSLSLDNKKRTIHLHKTGQSYLLTTEKISTNRYFSTYAFLSSIHYLAAAVCLYRFHLVRKLECSILYTPFTIFLLTIS
jgi:hypothetical protein